jgi:hypothetical protein
MDQSHLISIALHDAVLCESCREISRKSLSGCAICGQRTLIELSGLLEGTEPDGLLREVEQNVWLQRIAKCDEVC